MRTQLSYFHSVMIGLQRRFLTSTFLALGLFFVSFSVSAEIHYEIIYKEPGRFGGWPANHGIWAWSGEILVGFTIGHIKDQGPRHHTIDRDKPEEHWLARSRDGGETWSLEHPAEKGQLVPYGTALHGYKLTDGSQKAIPLTEAMNFSDSGFAMTLRRIDNDKGPTWLYFSDDRGHNWRGPFRFPDLGTPGVAARTDYIVDGPRELLAFLTCAKPNGEEGRPAVARTTDGGLSWEFLSYIGPVPGEFSIMPSGVRLSGSRLVAAVRRREGTKRWIEAYASSDNGTSWDFLSTPVPDTGEGNPPCLILLHDGRICLTYGYRGSTSAICARLSSDSGENWGPEITLRDHAPEKDVGYTRTVQRPDGKIVTVYFFHNTLLGERFIEAAIWDPDEI
jgi:hypothetical protein